MDIVDFALHDLHSNYVFSGHEYPLQPEFETSRQKRRRKIIVKEWERALKGWQITAEQKANIFAMLFSGLRTSQPAEQIRRNLATRLGMLHRQMLVKQKAQLLVRKAVVRIQVAVSHFNKRRGNESLSPMWQGFE